MKVQRCHACGARYNADRLEVGSVFDCNRCGAAVTVEASSPVSIPLLLTGFLILATLFLWSPAAGTAGLMKPWEELQGRSDLVAWAGTGLWALLGLWAVITALVPGARGRSVLTLALGMLALALATGEAGGGFPITVDRSLVWMLGAVALGAGFVLVGRGHRGVTPTALLMGGGLWILFWYLAQFDPAGRTLLEQIHGRIRDAMSESATTSTGQLAESAGVHIALLLAAAGGVVVALGLRLRPLAMILGVLLVVAMLLPGAIRIGESLGGEFQWGTFVQNLARGTGTALVRDGVALWALLAYAAADLARARGGAA